MNDDFNTGWDPYQQLLQAEANIHQLAACYNSHETQLKELRGAYNHQQEVIKQLMFQNQKLNQLLAMSKSDISRLGTEVELLKAFK
jgi:cell shape-determining protein MreC